MNTTLHDKMLAAIDALFSASDAVEEEAAENLLLDVRDEIRKRKQAEQPLTDEQIDLLINGRGEEDDDDYVEPTGDGFGLTDADLVRLVRRVEAAHGITKGNT